MLQDYNFQLHEHDLNSKVFFVFFKKKDVLPFR